ncbi:LysE family translocator [Litoribacillus peritrichatus]|uniref:LysE family translocator n=2 Tax=Litoribacillus peritrichatus TaxID=718191 RepID=A0ABP7MEM2_9GAMM
MGLFALSMSISPGPVNFITFSSGMNSGLRASMGFVSGATLGFTGLLMVVGFGLTAVPWESSDLYLSMSILGASVIGYIGYQIFSSNSDINPSGQGDTVRASKPSFWQGVLLQWLNPKAWAACVAGVSAFNLNSSASQLMVFILVYFFVCYCSIAGWAYAGSRVRDWVKAPQALSVLNMSMGICLMGVSIYLLLMAFF